MNIINALFRSTLCGVMLYIYILSHAVAAKPKPYHDSRLVYDFFDGLLIFCMILVLTLQSNTALFELRLQKQSSSLLICLLWFGLVSVMLCLWVDININAIVNCVSCCCHSLLMREISFYLFSASWSLKLIMSSNLACNVSC